MAISIPAISTGIFKFPLNKFALIFSKALIKFIDINEEKMKYRKIILWNFDDDTTNTLYEFISNYYDKNIKDNENKNKEENEKPNKNKKKSKKNNDSEDENNEEEVRKWK